VGARLTAYGNHRQTSRERQPKNKVKGRGRGSAEGGGKIVLCFIKSFWTKQDSGRKTGIQNSLDFEKRYSNLDKGVTPKDVGSPGKRKNVYGKIEGS